MWTAGLSITSTLLSLYVAGATAQNGVICNSKIPVGKDSSGLQTSANGLAMKLCDAHVKDSGHTPFISDKGLDGVVLTITHSDETSKHTTAEDCAAHFSEIVEQCILKMDVWGGTVDVDGILYEIYQDNTISSRGDSVQDEEGVIETRRLESTRSTKKTKPKEKTPKKTEPEAKKPAKVTKVKSASKVASKTHSKTHSKATATPTPTMAAGFGSCPYKPGSKGKIHARGDCKIPEDEWMRIELNGLADTSDLTSSNPCNHKKRSIEEPQSHALLDKRMSGHGKELTWTEWQTVLEQLDTEFGDLLGADAGKEKVTIIWAGGISGIHLGSRGKKGATGDIDFLYHTKTSTALRAKFKTAIETTIKKNPNTLNQKHLPISNSLEFKAPEARLKKWSALADASTEPVAWEGKHIKAVDGDWLFQLFGKMSRMYQMRSKLSPQDKAAKRTNGQHKKRDEQDAKVFFKKWAAANRGDLTMKDFTALEGVFEKDQEYVEKMVGNTIKLVVGDKLEGVDAKIKDLSKAAGC